MSSVLTHKQNACYEVIKRNYDEERPDPTVYRLHLLCLNKKRPYPKDLDIQVQRFLVAYINVEDIVHSHHPGSCMLAVRGGDPDDDKSSSNVIRSIVSLHGSQ